MSGVSRPSAAVPHGLGHASAAGLDGLASQWVRVGAFFRATAAREPVDLERLILATAHEAPDDERLFVVAGSWLATHHSFVNGRRLATLAKLAKRTTARNESPTASAVLGALLTWADGLAGGSTSLAAAAAHCRALSSCRPLFRVMRQFPSLQVTMQAKALPQFSAWGLWHTDDTPKWNAVRPTAWLLDHAPEIRLRAIVGPSLEADVLASILLGLPDASHGRTVGNVGVTVRDIARHFTVSYAATHDSAAKLASRGLLTRERAGVRQYLRPTTIAVSLLG
jgi:hypothetical protein